MLRILGNPKRLCDGLTRRDLLRVGTLGGLGLAAGRGLASGSSRGSSFGRARSCILLFLYGAPSQIETFDPKPGLPPRNIRGDLGRCPCAATKVPGLSLANGLPRLAKVVDKAAIVRSGSDASYPIHGVAYAALTGIPRIDVALGAEPARPVALAFPRGRWSTTPIGRRPSAALTATSRGTCSCPGRSAAIRRIGEVPRAGLWGLPRRGIRPDRRRLRRPERPSRPRRRSRRRPGRTSSPIAGSPPRADSGPRPSPTTPAD